MIGAANLSPVTNLVAGTGAVSRYKVDRSQKSVTVQDLYCVQMSVSGCNGHYKFVLGAGVKAKSVTNNLPILSVLCAVLFKNLSLDRKVYFLSMSLFDMYFMEQIIKEFIPLHNMVSNVESILALFCNIRCKNLQIAF